MLRKHFLMSIFFFSTPLCSMEPTQPGNKQQLSIVLSQDVIEKHMMPSLHCFQDVARFRQTCTAHTYFNPEKVCQSPLGCASTCPTHACRNLVANFNACTKALAHFAKTNEKMFNHLWIYDQKKRDDTVCTWFEIEIKKMKPIDRLDMYHGASNTREQIKDKRIEKLKHLLKSNNVDAVIAIFHTFDSTDNPHNKSVLHYVAEHGTTQIMTAILPLCMKYVNTTDIHGCTPLHYASASRTYHSASLCRLLLTSGADCNVVDNKGRCALDF